MIRLHFGLDLAFSRFSIVWQAWLVWDTPFVTSRTVFFQSSFSGRHSRSFHSFSCKPYQRWRYGVIRTRFPIHSLYLHRHGVLNHGHTYFYTSHHLRPNLSASTQPGAASALQLYDFFQLPLFAFHLVDFGSKEQLPRSLLTRLILSLCQNFSLPTYRGNNPTRYYLLVAISQFVFLESEGLCLWASGQKKKKRRIISLHPFL